MNSEVIIAAARNRKRRGSFCPSFRSTLPWPNIAARLPINGRRRAKAAGAVWPGLPAWPTCRKCHVVYGKPFILMEDAEKNTFVYKAGEWVAYEATVADGAERVRSRPCRKA